jgi:YbbR domain-containing protein
MPFQDIDDVSISGPPRAPSGLERAFRKIFIEDWSLKLLALTISLVLWLTVTGQNEPVTIRTSVLLNFIRPESFEIGNDPPRSVDVLLTASRHKLDRLSLPDLVATVDLSDQHAGERVLRLSDKAQMELPDGVKINAFQPSAIPIRLEPIVERQLGIEPQLEGKPAEGYEVYSFHADKSSVTVHGPANHVNALLKAPTETISLGGRRESFTAPNVAIDIPDPKVDLFDPVVTVEVEIGELRTEKTFAGIPLSGAPSIQPRTTTVTLFGPASLLAELRPQDIRIVVESTGNTVEPRLELPPSFQGRIILRPLKSPLPPQNK